MRKEGNSQRHKDTKMFTGEDALDARSRTRLILGNIQSNQNWRVTHVGVKTCASREVAPLTIHRTWNLPAR